MRIKCRKCGFLEFCETTNDPCYFFNKLKIKKEKKKEFLEMFVKNESKN
jgi:hypothetical protein